MSVDGVVIGEGTEPGYYEILPGGSESCPVFSSTVQAVPIRGEEFAAGERVDLIQIDSEFGAAKKTNGIKGCLSIPEDSKGAIIAGSPAMTAAAYIGRAINLYVSPYSVGTVKANNGSALSVDYNGSTKNLFVAPGLSASDFAVDDLVVVNKWEYSSPLVIGWWQPQEPVGVIINRRFRGWIKRVTQPTKLVADVTFPIRGHPVEWEYPDPPAASIVYTGHIPWLWSFVEQARVLVEGNINTRIKGYNAVISAEASYTPGGISYAEMPISAPGSFTFDRSFSRLSSGAYIAQVWTRITLTPK